MKLELDKTYKTRNGSIVTIVNKSFSGFYVSSSGLHYHENGTLAAEYRGMDIVEEFIQ